ncbi:hypothetical protein F750_3347 [Streptomyces sp. PAMC 26508]|nr:hypothetical protein F750_3347 [Streptomyces sp. PAMC 26508]
MRRRRARRRYEDGRCPNIRTDGVPLKVTQRSRAGRLHAP